MSRNFDFSQAANKGVTVLPDLSLGTPTVGDVLSVKATTGGVVTTKFAAPGGSVSGVASFNTRTGAVTLTSGDVTSALTFTPYNATNPAGYQTTADVTSLLANYLPLGGGTLTGQLILSGLPSGGNDAASKTYVDTKAASSGVTQFNSRTGAVTLSSTDVTTALTFTPYNATNPASYVNAAGAAAAAPVQSVAGHTGTVTLTHSDITDWAATLAPYALTTALPAARNLAKLQAQWVTGAIVANDTVWLAYDAPYAGTINSLTYFTGNGSFSVAIQINGTNVTGLSAVAVSSATPATTNATAANTFTAGQRITAVITAATSSPTDALLSLAVTWS